MSHTLSGTVGNEQGTNEQGTGQVFKLDKPISSLILYIYYSQGMKTIAAI